MNLDVLITMILIPAAAWVIHTLLAVKGAVMELRTVLIGIDGQNGMRSTVNGIEKKQENHEHRITILEHPPREAA